MLANVDNCLSDNDQPLTNQLIPINLQIKRFQNG